MSGWQPIETAPKDGTPIIVAVPCDKSLYGWLVGEARWRCEGDNDDGIWWANTGPCEIGQEPLHRSGYRATHWMPMPKPPEGET